MTIVSFSTYPIDIPIHGGQRRLAAIHDRFAEAGLSAVHISVENPSAYAKVDGSTYRIMATEDFMHDLAELGLREDVHISKLFENELQLARLAALVLGAAPSAFWLEQPWLWPALKRLRKMFPSLRDIPVVYSSQNQEAVFFRDLDASLAAEVDALEADLTKAAEVIFAVSEADVSYYRRHDAKRAVLAPNGIGIAPKPGGLDYWEKELGATRNALFVGSAHPPNASGFLEMFGSALGYLNPMERILVVGGVRDLLMQSSEFRRHLPVNLNRTIMLGTVNDVTLGAAIQYSDIVVLPLSHGGGSNIKTAEALRCRKPIIATSKAFVGYEAYKNLKWVTIADDPADFQAAVLRELRQPAIKPVEVSDVHEELLKMIYWPECLKPIVNTLKEVGLVD